MKIEGRLNPFTGAKVILYVENQPRGLVARATKLIKYPIKLSDADAQKLQREIAKEESDELWGPED